MRRLVAVIVAVLLIAACGDDAPKQGMIKDKDHRAAYDTHYYVSHCVSYNKNGTCNVSIPVEQTDHHNEQWRLFLEDCQPDKNGKTKCQSGWLDVTEDAYNRFNVGQHYPNPT